MSHLYGGRARNFCNTYISSSVYRNSFHVACVASNTSKLQKYGLKMSPGLPWLNVFEVGSSSREGLTIQSSKVKFNFICNSSIIIRRSI